MTQFLKSSNIPRWMGRLLQAIVMGYQALALLALVYALYLGLNWIRQPFIGAFVEHSMVFNGVGPADDPAWTIFNQNIRFGDRLLEIAGTQVNSAAEMQDMLSLFEPGKTVLVSIQRADGSISLYDVTLQAFPQDSIISYFLIPSLVSLVYLGVSLWIFGFRRAESAGRAFALFSSSVAIVSGAFFDLYTTHRLTTLWTLSIGVAGGALFDLTLTFPQETRFTLNRPYLRWLGYAAGLGLALYAFPTLYNLETPTLYFSRWVLLYGFMAAVLIFFIGGMVVRALTTRSPIIKNQSQTILWGTLLAFGPLFVWLLASTSGPINFSPNIFVSTVIFPIAIGYTILRFRLLQADYLLTQVILYAFLSVLAVSGYALLITGLSLIFSGLIDSMNPIIVGVIVFALVLLLNPLRTRLQGLIDAIFFRGKQAYQQRLQEFGHELTSALALPTILKLLRDNIHESMIPSQLHIFVHDPVNDQYVAAPDENDRPTTDIRFAASSPLVHLLDSERIPLYVDPTNLPVSLVSEKPRLALLGATLFVPLAGKDRPVGWLALGPRRSGQVYSGQELNFLDNLSDQAALAIERAQIVDNLERRVQEMNALTRVAQGVNIPLTFDDVLELIYAQTTLIIPATDLHITLYNQGGKYNYYAFCIEHNDRDTSRENVPLPGNQGLEGVVLQTSRPIVTQDYTRECQLRKVLPSAPGLYAWMGVPLNAGAETIGALSVGSRQTDVLYTRAQLNLLQAIADQTAGAIVKARLLEETEKRARQLTTLNDITRQLTSTLELEPLLQNILENAADILNCEAGSLFLTDDQSDDMIFKVTVGPVASDLLGQRMPSNRGIVGQVVQSRQPLIENDAQNSPFRFAAPDEKTGFITRTILAVPLEVKERIIGVIEIINRKDGMPFDEDDKNLLTAFAGQAAVAIENARLYTSTDQELAARVEELSVMQRIDRELNASLDVARAMRITLDWALRQSAAQAGMICTLEERGLRLMAHQGYNSELDEYETSHIPVERPSIRAAIETGQTQHAVFDPGSNGSGGFLTGVVSQVIIPIRREATVIGLLLLESTQTADAQEDLGFLNRLSDHAAIAIANAQLYTAVQDANAAKSEFVSFVAHELKNPMTSIKGYTELLAGGQVGQINEMQANFLNTIRSNVQRMDTLVSDLNDNSKIEAGRLRLQFAEVKVPDVVDDAVRSTRRQIEDKKQTIAVEIPESLPPVWADRTRIGQVLVNLVSNAHKYTPEGGHILIGAEATENQWDPQGAPRVVHIWVEDNGIGISVEDQRKIFTKFFRSEDQSARESPGTGLGLNITKSLVEMQNGRIWFESEFRKGTTFHFTIPVAEA